MVGKLLFVLVAALAGASGAADLVVHEWGTITTIHDVAGTPEGGLNRIDADDVLPSFVHRWEPDVTRELGKELGKKPFITGRPDITMRLETPVLYFHPPAGQAFEAPFDITVRFRGGVLNEYFPDAEPEVHVDDDRLRNKLEAGVLKPWDGHTMSDFVVGSLKWTGLRIHDTVVAPLTNSPIWIAPREVQAASVFLPSAGEGERYVFYRGVAHLDALIQTKLRAGALTLSAPAQLAWLDAPTVTLPNVWYADIRKDGVIAFRDHGALTLTKDKPGVELARLKGFAGPDYKPQNAAGLRKSLRAALVKAGLFADEADAMLNTWKASYFEKPGLRVFYVVPRAWTDYFLPIEFSVPARVSRVIVGRIDITR